MEFAFFLFILCMDDARVGRNVCMVVTYPQTDPILFILTVFLHVYLLCVLLGFREGVPTNNSIHGFRFEYWNFSLSPPSRPECVFLIPSCLAYCGIWLLFFVWVAKSRDSLFKLLDFVIKLEVSGLPPSLELVVLLLSFFFFK